MSHHPVDRLARTKALDFPGAFTAAVVFSGMAVFGFVAWPWLALHGTARIVVGTGWSVLLGAVAVLVVAIAVVSRRDVR